MATVYFFSSMGWIKYINFTLGIINQVQKLGICTQKHSGL